MGERGQIVIPREAREELYCIEWFLSSLGISGGRANKRISPSWRLKAKIKALYRKQVTYFTKTAMDMGELIIKLGQYVVRRWIFSQRK